MIAAIFSESIAFDVTVLATVFGMFATIIGMLRGMKKNREAEIERAVETVLTAKPEQVALTPQPLVVKLKEEFVLKTEHELVEKRVAALEQRVHEDKQELLREIGAVPHKTIALLRDTKGLI